MPDGPRGPLTPSGPPLGGDRDVAFRKPRNWWQKHLREIIAVVVVVVVIGGITATFLATRNLDDVSVGDPASVSSSAAPPSASPSASPTPTAKPTTPAAAPPTTLKAVTVVAVVAPGKWTVQVQKGLNLTVVANTATTYAKGKSADDVKKNSSITVVGTVTAGVVTAKTVTIEKKKSSS